MQTGFGSIFTSPKTHFPSLTLAVQHKQFNRYTISYPLASNRQSNFEEVDSFNQETCELLSDLYHTQTYDCQYDKRGLEMDMELDNNILKTYLKDCISHTGKSSFVSYRVNAKHINSPFLRIIQNLNKSFMYNLKHYGCLLTRQR